MKEMYAFYPIYSLCDSFLYFELALPKFAKINVTLMFHFYTTLKTSENL